MVALQPGPQTRISAVTGDPGALAGALRRAGIDDDPDRTLQLAATVPPAQWKPEERLPVLAVILALSTGGKPGVLTSLIETLREFGTPALAAFTDPATPPTLRTLPLGPYQARVSYGCFELAGPDLNAEARVAFSVASDRCDSFR